jgi:alpha-glucosidase (family GH31 glycosyl hydrolase)
MSMILVSGLNSMPFIGEDVGGYYATTTEELATRWFQLGAWTYPFFRSHCMKNSARREPWLFPSPTRERIVKAITDRYMLLAVWYTSAIYATRIGRGPVVPLWLEWPEIDSFHDIDRATVLGDSLLVFPVLDANSTHVDVVKPPGVWYDFFTGEAIKGDFVKEVSLDEIAVFVRGGRIVPLYRTPGQATLNTITTPLTLLIAGDANGYAEGSLYLDDGVSYEYEEGKFVHRNYTFNNGILKSTKGDRAEKEIPTLLRDCIVNSLDIYVVKPDGSSDVKHFKGLNLKLSDEWTWSENPEFLKAESERKAWKSLAIVSIVFGAVMVIAVVVILKSGKKNESNIERPPYT